MPGSDEVHAAWRATLLSDANDLAVVALSDGVVQAANRAAVALFGEIVPGAEVWSLFDEHTHAKLATLLAQDGTSLIAELQVVHRGELPEAVKFVVLAGPGRERLLVACAPGAGVAEVSGKLMAINDALVELTRRLSRDVRAADAERQALQQLGNLRELFIAAMAHDLKSPLQAILLGEELLRRASPEGRFDVQGHIARVERQAQRMVFLIDSLLVAARLDATAPGLPTEPVDVAQIARETVAAFEALAQQAEVRLAVTTSGDARALGNRVWLGEVFANLLANALRHSPRGGRVDVEVRRDGDRVHGAVGDQGPGVPAAQRESVFERFVQHGEQKGAIGLGLYVCKRVVELHGGRIQVDAGGAPGARFVFEIPALAP